MLLLDEPLSALDEFLRLRMRGELKSLQMELGITFVHVTHTQPEAIALADMVVVMDTGRSNRRARRSDIFNQPKTPYVARFMGGQNVLTGTVELVSGGEVLARDARGVRFAVKARTGSFAPGSKIACSIRRDRIALGRAGSGSTTEVNHITGTAHQIEYQGTYVKVSIDVGGREFFVVYLRDIDFFADPIAMGDKVTASWLTEQTYLLEVPDTEEDIDPL